jgi:phosphatidylinositol kinase/protein kinase (PI-3  family)
MGLLAWPHFAGLSDMANTVCARAEPEWNTMPLLIFEPLVLQSVQIKEEREEGFWKDDSCHRFITG